MKTPLESYPELLQGLKSLLHNKILFYRYYQIVQAVPRQLSWTHLIEKLVRQS